MPRTSGANQSELRRWSDRLRRQDAVAAVRAGQAVMEAGLRRRCPVGATHRLLGSIHATRVGVGRHSAGGFVAVGTPYAAYVEARHPFVRPTARTDWPLAAHAMIESIRKHL